MQKTIKKVFFEEANGGIIFLDEIGDISSFMQTIIIARFTGT